VYGRVFGVAVLGVLGRLIRVEAHVGRGLPSLTVTGLPGAGVLDARERVRPAVEGAGLEWPLRRVVVNLSPANLKKEGPGFDLPIAMGVLAASAQVPARRLARYAFAGELSLKGELVATPGILAVAMAAARGGLAGVVVPRANAAEASLVEGLEVIAAPDLRTAVAFLRGQGLPDQAEPAAGPATGPEAGAGPAVGAVEPGGPVDLAEVRGQGTARRALEVAAAGGHNVLMVGPPGAGKTMLARRLPGILPAMTRQEALEVTVLHSIAGLLNGGGLVRARPFRAPHHSVSMAGLLGGGSGYLRPGEVSLAHSSVALCP
jgi:magnesium chelatase family protein